MMLYPDPLVLMQFHETNLRTREYVAGLPPIPPDDNMIDAGDQTQLSIPDAAETSTITSSDVVGDVD